MLAFLLVLVNLHTVKDVCQDSHPGVAQQSENNSMPPVVEGCLTAGVVESYAMSEHSKFLTGNE